MKKITTILLIAIIAIVITIITGSFERKYTAVVGNVCEATEDNLKGLCYKELHMKGFPIAYVKDSPGVSVQGALGSEDYLDFPRLIIASFVNWLIYFGILFFSFSFFRKITTHNKV